LEVEFFSMSSSKSKKDKKPTVTPNAFMDHDKKFYYIQVELPGVEKKDVELSVSDQSFCVRAPREDIEYLGCYVLAHLADTEETKAKFENGLLSIEIPLKKMQKEKKVAIE
jgi:HSP20 family protein